MPSIAVQIITGPGRTRREVFTEPVVSFGRGADNLVVLATPTASRQHGELRFIDNHWSLVNLSPNGTQVNGRKVKRKPRPLHDRDLVAIGDEPVFRVMLAAEPATAAAAEEPTAADAPAGQPAMNRRAKLWIGIGIYLVFMLALMVFFSTLGGHEQEVGPAPELTPEQIRQAITRPLHADAIDPRRSQQYLETATQLFNKLDTSPNNLYKAYHNYQLALATRGQTYFSNDLDQLRYLKTQQSLVETVTKLYRDGYSKLRSLAFRDAEAVFRRLEQEVYQDTDSPIYRNVEQQRNAAAAGLKKQNQ